MLRSLVDTATKLCVCFTFTWLQASTSLLVIDRVTFIMYGLQVTHVMNVYIALRFMLLCYMYSIVCVVTFRLCYIYALLHLCSFTVTLCYTYTLLHLCLSIYPSIYLSICGIYIAPLQGNY